MQNIPPAIEKQTEEYVQHIWNNLPNEDKAFFEELSNGAQKRYEEEWSIYKAYQADGTLPNLLKEATVDHLEDGRLWDDMKAPESADA